VIGLYHTIMGLPRSGKTTFLAALWHILDAGETDTRLVLDKLVGDHTHLNSIVAAWRRCEPMPRTSIAAETVVTIHMHEPASDQRVILSFPDLSGESMERQFAERTGARDFVAGTARAGGIMLFINADRGHDGITILDVAEFGGDALAGEIPSPQVATPWSPSVVPEQAQLVDLLQHMMRPPFERRVRRLAIIISAWDVVGDITLTPEAWLGREMPLLDQFLKTNAAVFETASYGVSAQGGRLDADDREPLARQVPSLRIRCVGLGVAPHDITAPISWLNAGSDR